MFIKNTLIIYFLINIFSTSSRVLPLVSGSFFRINRKPSAQIPEYTQNVPCAPRLLLSIGNRITSKKLAIHNEVAAVAMAAPLIRFGNISERTTHVTGARVIA